MILTVKPNLKAKIKLISHKAKLILKNSNNNYILFILNKNLFKMISEYI